MQMVTSGPAEDDNAECRVRARVKIIISWLRGRVWILIKGPMARRFIMQYEIYIVYIYKIYMYACTPPRLCAGARTYPEFIAKSATWRKTLQIAFCARSRYTSLSALANFVAATLHRERLPVVSPNSEILTYTAR